MQSGSEVRVIWKLIPRRDLNPGTAVTYNVAVREIELTWNLELAEILSQDNKELNTVLF